MDAVFEIWAKKYDDGWVVVSNIVSMKKSKNEEDAQK